jgi:hypothetical protein
MGLLSGDQLLDRLSERWDNENGYTLRPVQWVRDKAGDHLTAAQRSIAESVRDNRYTAVHSAHDLGKSAVAGRVGAWWIDSYPPGDAFVVSTAPTAAQVTSILWREIGKVHRKARLAGRITRSGYPTWHIGNELIGYGRKPADHEESAFQGIHALHVLVLIDEAGGVARHLYDAVDSLATNEYARVLAIGNPDDPGSHFATICKPGSDWNVIHLDGLRSPNMNRETIIGSVEDGFGPRNPRYPLTAALMEAEGIGFSDEEIPPQLRPMLISPLWVEERLRRWGGLSKTAHIELGRGQLKATVRNRAEASPLIQAKVRGIFPTSTATGVIPLGWVQYAVNRWNDWNDAGRDLTKMNPAGNRVVGVDVAYGGQDETCIALRFGNIVTDLHRYRHADTTETADYAALHLHEPQSVAVVDVIGIGAGVYDTLRRYRREGKIVGRSVPFNASAASQRTDKIGEFKFRNDRAAAWWRFREMLDPSRGSTIMLPDDERLIEELVAVKYTHLIGVIKIEDKDEIRKRLGRSTDSADAVIQAFWVQGLDVREMPDSTLANRQASRDRGEVVNYDGWTPFDESDFSVDDLGASWLTETRMRSITAQEANSAWSEVLD